MLVFMWVVFVASLTGAGLAGVERYDKMLKARKLRELGQMRVAMLETDRARTDKGMAAQPEIEALDAKMKASNPAGLHP